MTKSGIYKLTNKVNEKIYVGSAKDVSHRLSEHKWYLKKGNHENGHLQNAVNKYGIENFKFEIIEEVGDKTKLIEREQYYLDLYKCYEEEIGYNIRRKAESNLGLKHTTETIRKISEGNKGKNLGRKHTIEQRLKNSQSSIGKKKRKKTTEERLQISLRMKGNTPWNKGKKCKTLKGRPAWNKGISHTKEVKEKIRQLALKRYRKI